ncbi:unnamed protein product [Schistosoma rodhaini]|nr:unnamed protein product [Schistosoma rodhaini]
MLLDDSMSNLIISSNSRTDAIHLIKSELAAVYKQLSDMRSKVESLAGSLLKHNDLKLELKTLSPLRLLLSKDIVTSELEDRIKVESVIDLIASEVAKRIIFRNNVIIL